MANTLSMTCSSNATVRYSTEQTMSMAMDDLSANEPIADRDSGSV